MTPESYKSDCADKGRGIVAEGDQGQNRSKAEGGERGCSRVRAEEEQRSWNERESRRRGQDDQF
jgi:hypothetical protein